MLSEGRRGLLSACKYISKILFFSGKHFRCDAICQLGSKQDVKNKYHCHMYYRTLQCSD